MKREPAIGIQMKMREAVVSRYVRLTTVEWVRAPYPPKNLNTQQRLWRRTQLRCWIIWGGKVHMFLDIQWFFLCTIKTGAMIACKLAAMVPERVLSLALLNVTGGGFECFPKLDRQTLSIAIRFLRAKTPEQRAAVDLDTHYSKEYLEEYVGPNTRRSILYQEYVRCISATGMQSNNGFEGQVNACWTHKMTRLEIERIHSAGFLVSVIHGRHDIIAQLYYARRLAEKLQPAARMIELHGGHLVSHERTEEVNQALLELIKASEVKINPHEWTNLPKKTSGWIGTRMALIRVNMEGGSNVSFPFYLLSKLHIFLLYLFGLFFMAFEYGRRALKGFKTVRVGPSLALPNGE
ncbi:uncharacterized protein LOC122310824 isoform X3 [Carya illinoinensis]|uniref:uncharacterized protein LOC122310824 isoform X3 n=1 Tax=Carya illinoinensis TaxID=32201 RepID=UPI001C7222A9|nr:uncharacterized protein LOC122310824 isoform X3 [Carya illinoinensis]